MEQFKTILEKEVSAEIVEKKSRFIANIFLIESPQDAEEKIKVVKKLYHDAKHNCYAYLTRGDNGITEKFSDDGEPSGTAGAPMLEMLKKMNLYNVVIVVTRYFGGILLGTGGLVRAYSDATKKAISNATLVSMESGFELSIKISYPNFEKFKYFCSKKNIKIVDSVYSDIVICNIELNEDEKEKLMKDFNEENTYNILQIDTIRQKNIPVMSNNVN